MIFKHWPSFGYEQGMRNGGGPPKYVLQTTGAIVQMQIKIQEWRSCLIWIKLFWSERASKGNVWVAFLVKLSPHHPPPRPHHHHPHQRERDLGGPTMLVERSPAQRRGGRSYQRETLSLPHRLVLFRLTELYVQYVLDFYLSPNQKVGKPCIKMYFCAVLSCIESER